MADEEDTNSVFVSSMLDISGSSFVGTEREISSARRLCTPCPRYHVVAPAQHLSSLLFSVSIFGQPHANLPNAETCS